MVYRALTEYLLKHKPAKGIPLYVGLVPVAATFGAMVLSLPAILVAVVSAASIVLTIWLEIWLHGRRRRKLAVAERLHEDDWLASLKRFARERQLESRSHPHLIEDLEACARLRREILDALESEEWERLSRQPDWQSVRDQCRESAESLFRDALWSAKGAMRAVGGRKETFAKRCEDPAFASDALGGVKLVRAQLAKLLDEVYDDPFAGQGVRDALARAEAELKAIRDAEAEVRGLS